MTSNELVLKRLFLLTAGWTALISGAFTPGCGDDTDPQPLCGNGAIDANEICDGAKLGGKTCLTEGFSAGTLRCRQDCSGYDTNECVAADFTDNGDGTVTDTRTGLRWQKNSGGAMSFDEAVAYCQDLELAGFLDWHLPTIDELRFLIRGCPATEPAGSCAVHDGCAFDCWSAACDGCNTGQGPGPDSCYIANVFSDTACYYHRSVSDYQDSNEFAWLVYFLDGRVVAKYKTFDYAVRCVHRTP